ncbi:hypothetical protein [Aquibacillus salsiterrae]|uniref:Uncharacterized protein n=1 Tax=Aquibacillus salsiterrae TaxID=2950439 RepID=A0A9X3WEZ5_9BACI|nr:hypothetical protein [Aquibacillus salsiterrae]MDC3417468.1 hypothetical protein [Aquibacillus salsiterrae]
MTQYIFVVDKLVDSTEIKVEATGMMDAFHKIKEIRNKIMEETSSIINIRFKGVLYP